MARKAIDEIVSHVPDISRLVAEISDAMVEYPKGNKKRIRDHVKDSVIRIRKNTEASNAEKFMRFIVSFLYVQVRTEIADKASSIVTNQFSGVDDAADADSSALAQEFKRIGYRFPERARTIVEVAKVIRDRFEGDMDRYVRFVEQNYREDPVLKVRGVGYKTRDVALSNFTEKYSLVDTHIIDVLARTGLILNAYHYGLPLTTDRSKDSNYLAISRLMTKLAEEAKISPFILDQYFWFLGRDFCSKKNCDPCPVTRCVYRDYAKEREKVNAYTRTYLRRRLCANINRSFDQ